MEPSSNPDADQGIDPAAQMFVSPQLNLPKGGGALRGIGEKFSTNPVTGTGSINVPIPTSPGRSGFSPQLSLSYNSGIGNSAFGMGWSLSLPAITRKTDKGLPRYDDVSESDVFIFSGVEDLVPLLDEEHGQTRQREYTIKSYCPRTEGLFARIERWTCVTDGLTHWRTISRDNVLTVYGFDSTSRIADPLDPARVFSWLISCSYDDRGNAISYEYLAENDDGIDPGMASERNRARHANRYVKRIRYGNRAPLLLDPASSSLRQSHLGLPDHASASWMFSVVFDYGDQHCRDQAADRISASAGPLPSTLWQCRADPFSSYRSGFEIRTYRLCKRVLMFHHFPEELGAADCLVRSTAIHYRERDSGSLIERVVQSGHVLQDDQSYLTRSMPALDFSYTDSPFEEGSSDDFIAQDVDPASLANLPGGVDGDILRWVDLDGEGIAGVLAEHSGAWLYKHNLGAGQFGATETVRQQPTLATWDGRAQRLMDVAGDGNLDLVDFSASSPGFYNRTADAGWLGFRAFLSLPVLNWRDPNLRFVDLTGDGVADILITENDALVWHASLLEQGYGAAIRVPVPLYDEESGPRALFADPTQSIFLADMSGDGLSDILRVRNGEVCYWPNLGYGRFGAKVTMDHAPWFEQTDLFDQRRLRLSDTDGSGTTDLIYLGHDGARVFLNYAGNSFSSGRHIANFPPVDNLTTVDVADLLGRGTACLIWSSPLPRDAGRQLRYIDLMCGKKPYLLSGMTNNMGALTQIDYATSTEFYLADQAAGTPWVTRLPFPVHVVKTVKSYDTVSRSRMVTHYSYHHGFYDGLEREFRGFGRVDQLDTEQFARPSDTATLPLGDNWDQASSVPPVLVKTWYHTGVFLEGAQVSRHLAHEYFQAEAEALLEDTILPDTLTPFEAREACRALKGAMLHQETYALDGSARQPYPYSVTESNFTVETVQRKQRNRHAVFFTHTREAITLHYERNCADPRITHDLTLATDRYGNVLQSVSIGYQRRVPAFSEQAQTLAKLTQNQFTNSVLLPDAHRTPLPAEVKIYQLTGPQLVGCRPFSLKTVKMLVDSATEIAYDAQPTRGKTEKRLINQVRSSYRKNDLSGLLPTGVLESLALPGENDKRAFTDGLLELYRDKVTPAELKRILAEPGSGYRDLDGDGPYWIPSGRVFYSPQVNDLPHQEFAYALQHFFLPHRYLDAFGASTVVEYDTYQLAPVLTRDAVDNQSQAELDYRVLQPKQLTDPNGNRSWACFDALGMLIGTALGGKESGPVEGDSFDTFITDLELSAIQQFLDADDPIALAQEFLGTASTRIIYDFSRIPVCSASIGRETHVSALTAGQTSRVQLSFLYSDGFGRAAQKKIQAEPGPLPPGDPAAPLLKSRWIGSGAMVYNNKGKPVRQYEPFFSSTPHYGIEQWGVSSVLFYDPAQRVVATLHANHSIEKVWFDAWKHLSYDVNDTVTIDPRTDPDIGPFLRRLPERDYLPTWYQQRIGGALGEPEKTAAEQAARHANTPNTVHLDGLGRSVRNVAHNGNDESGLPVLYVTRTVFDVEGNQLAMIDALERVVLQCAYGMMRNRLYQRSMEAGARWMVNDAVGKPLRIWNSRDFALRIEYDALRRSVRSFVKGGQADAHGEHFDHEVMFEKVIYGDSPETGLTPYQQRQQNLRGKKFRHGDSAGLLGTTHYDFKGNILITDRQFAQDFKHTPDWHTEVALDTHLFDSVTQYDALNRAIAVKAPDGSIYRPGYNDTGQLKAVHVNLRGAQQDGEPVWSPFVGLINYDAKGQRTEIRYANGAHTTYTYDDKTFRLLQLKTTRSDAAATGMTAKLFNNPGTVQDLHYTYDPVGNITNIEDAALRDVFHANHKVRAAAQFRFDALYRLLEATGREHVGQSAFAFIPSNGNDRDFPFVGAAQLHDLQALCNYVENYSYDEVGNFQTMRHHADGGSWQRHYGYQEPSLLDAGQNSNRLSHTSLHQTPGAPVERYHYDAHGNMTRMPQLAHMRWDFRDQLISSARQIVNQGTPETTYYVYDASGQRARKTTVRQQGGKKSERFYLNGFELYRQFNHADAVTLERETLHIHDDQQRIAILETQTVGKDQHIDTPVPVWRYQMANHLGSASLELDQDGRLLTYEEYSPFGNSSFQAGESAEVSLKRYRYTGKERDEENGFNYHGARYCIPWLGRWLNADPVGLQGGMNLYAYANNNPVILRDSKGTNPDDPPARFPMVPPNPADTYVVAFGRARTGYMDLAGTNTGLTPINIQWNINFNRGLGPIGISADEEMLTDAFITPVRGPRSDLHPMFSGVLAQEALEGTFASTVHFNLNGITLTPTLPAPPDTVVRGGGEGNTMLPYLPGFAREDFHSSSEARQVIAHLASTEANERNVDIFLQHEGGLTLIPRSSNTVVGAPLPDEWAAHVPNINNTPSGPINPMGGGMGRLGGVASNVGAQIVPGVPEGIMTTEALGYTAQAFGMQRLGTAALAGAKSPGPAAVGGIVGAPVGLGVEYEARQAGLGDTGSFAVGGVAAVATGAGVAIGVALAVATAPVSVPVLAGVAIVGGLSAGFGYLMAHM
ncbi:RHS repeat-associated protein [Oxalobacteraceae bacterium GrIS 2.11]